MKCIAVTTTNPAERLTAADVVVPSLAELAPDTVWRLARQGAFGGAFVLHVSVC